MRFERCNYPKLTKPRPAPSPRRMAAAQKAIERQRQNAGLLADWVVTETAEERIRRIDESTARHFQCMRNADAATWKRARRALYQLPEPTQKRLLIKWNTPKRWQPHGKSHYFADWLFHEILKELEQDIEVFRALVELAKQ